MTTLPRSPEDLLKAGRWFTCSRSSRYVQLSLTLAFSGWLALGLAVLAFRVAWPLGLAVFAFLVTSGRTRAWRHGARRSPGPLIKPAWRNGRHQHQWRRHDTEVGWTRRHAGRRERVSRPSHSHFHASRYGCVTDTVVMVTDPTARISAVCWISAQLL